MSMREYCIQHHVAKRAGPHDDFRFEHDGVAVSFCIPKGMKQHSRPVLAIHVNDHELTYMDFEGEIEEGRGGAGTVELVARGTLNLRLWDPKRLRVEIPDGAQAGTYTFVKLARPKHWLMLPRQ
jgi:DNA ligase D-like protein (predicted 3'-phosphoesterase)